jgi:signal transduction histidine kinase
LYLSISDDGTGGVVAGGGLGLGNLRDRVEAVGGALTVDSTPDNGTRLSIVLPAGSP